MEMSEVRDGCGCAVVILGIVLTVAMLFYSFTDSEHSNTEFDLLENHQVIQIDAPGGVLKATSKKPFDLRQKGTNIVLSSKPAEGKVVYEVADESASAGEWHLTGGQNVRVLVNGAIVKVESSFWYKSLVWFGWLIVGAIVIVIGTLIAPSQKIR